MSIESGKRYTIINKQSQTVVDLDTCSEKTVHGWSKHDGDNQQWDFIKEHDGWHIRNARKVGDHHVYLSFEGHPEDGRKVEALRQPFTWHIWPEGAEYRICVPETVQNLDLADFGNKTNGTLVQLWTKWDSNKNQVWEIKEVK